MTSGEAGSSGTSGQDHPETGGPGPSQHNSLLRKTATVPLLAVALLIVGVGAAGAIGGYALGRGRPSPSPHPAGQASRKTLEPTSESPSPTTQLSSLAPVTSAIAMGAACEWAYPGQASGKISGSDYSIVCLGADGQVLGGFSGSHSLNAWCADPSHTSGKDLPSPALVDGVWLCTP
jgi:hypothetical protein